MPSTITESKPSILGDFYQKLAGIAMMEFNPEDTVTPQIIKMTTYIDNALNEIQIIFSKMVDELIASKYDLLERDQQVLQLKQQQLMLSRPVTSNTRAQSRKSSSNTKEGDAKAEKEAKEQAQQQQAQLKLKEHTLSQKEQDVKNLEEKLKAREQSLAEKTKALEAQQKKMAAEREELESKRKELDAAAVVSTKKASAGSEKTAPKQDGAPGSAEEKKKLNKLMQSYQDLETKHRNDTQMYTKQIE